MQASDPFLPPPRKFQAFTSSPIEPSLLSASDSIPNAPLLSSEIKDLPNRGERRFSDLIPTPSAASVAEEDDEGCEGDDVSDEGNGGHTPQVSKRKEKFGLRKACERCRQRKNKCDGNFPCSMCVRSFQEIQAAGGICLYGSPEEMCVRNVRKPMSRTSSRHSNESKNSGKGTKNRDNGMVFLPVDQSLIMGEGDGIRRSFSDQLGQRLVPMRSGVEQTYAHDAPMHMDVNQTWISRDDTAHAEGGGGAVAEDSDAEGWAAGGMFMGPSVPRTQDFLTDEWTVSPAKSLADHMPLFNMQAQQTSEPRIHEPQKPPPSQHMIVDGIMYRTFNELSWLALELCEPLSSISLLFWRSLHQIDVPQWLSTRCLLACCNIRCDAAPGATAESGSIAPHMRKDVAVTADHHRLLQLAIIIHGCSSGEGEQVAISRDAMILLDSMIVRLVKKVLLSAKAAARGDIVSSTAPHASIGLCGAGGTFITHPPPDFTLVTAISVFISLCCAIGCVSAFSTTPDEDYDAIMSTLSALCNRYSISLGSIRSTFPYLSNVTDINLQYAFGEEIMQNLMQGSAHLLQADSLVTKLFCCDSFVLRLLARATCFKFLERFHSHTPFLPNDPPCMDPVHVFEGMSKAGDGGLRIREKERSMGGVCGSGSLSGDYSLAMLFGARHCMSRQLSLSQALGLNSGPAPPAFDLAAAGQHMEAIERIKKYFFTFRSIRQQKGAGNRSAATFFWFKWSLDAVSAVMLFKADTTSHHSTNDSPSCRPENNRDAALLLSLSSLVQEVVGLRQSMMFLMEPSAAAALTVIITIVMAQRARSPAYEEIWKSLFMAVSSAAASSGLRWWRRLAATVQNAPQTVRMHNA